MHAGNAIDSSFNLEGREEAKGRGELAGRGGITYLNVSSRAPRQKRRGIREIDVV